MNSLRTRREFGASVGALVGGLWVTRFGVAPAIAAPDVSLEALDNWAGSLSYGAAQLETPPSEEQVVELVRNAKRFKPLGTRHCFSAIADTDETLISTGKLDKVVAMRTDGAVKSVVVQPGIQYSTLGEWLHKRGYAVRNYASLPHISVAGALATATHGSGTQNLAADVMSLRLVGGNGEVHTLRRGDEDFPGAVVGLGALGFVTEVEIEVVESFQVRQEVYLHMAWDNLFTHFDEIMSGAPSEYGVYSPSVFLHWQEPDVSEVWYKMAFPDAEAPYAPMKELFGAKRAETVVHPVLELSAENCTPQLGVPGPSHERLPHFRPEFAPASGREIHTEIFVPWEHSVKALKAIRPLADLIGPLLYITELRSIKSDNLWMSTASGAAGSKWLSIQFSWRFDEVVTQERVMAVVPEIQRVLSPFGARPHWGKLFSWDAEYLRTVYPEMKRFVSLLKKYDPDGKLENAFLRRNILGK